MRFVVCIDFLSSIIIYIKITENKKISVRLSFNTGERVT